MDELRPLEQDEEVQEAIYSFDKALIIQEYFIFILLFLLVYPEKSLRVFNCDFIYVLLVLFVLFDKSEVYMLFHTPIVSFYFFDSAIVNL